MIDVIEIPEGVGTLQVCVNASTKNIVGVVDTTLTFDPVSAEGIMY